MTMRYSAVSYDSSRSYPRVVNDEPSDAMHDGDFLDDAIRWPLSRSTLSRLLVDLSKGKL